MFKTDPKSLEALSFRFSEQDIARFRNLLDLLKSDKLSSSSEEELTRLALGLDKIGELKLNGKIYAFHIDDSYAAEGGVGYDSGVELYKRQGERLEVFFQYGSRDHVYQVCDCVRKLKKNKIDTIYTGPILSQVGFLGLHEECDEKDPIITKQLEERDINEFGASGIKVICLDKLI
jgi:hypothetical protein